VLRVLRSPWLFQILAGGVLVGLAAWQIDFAALGSSFRHAEYGWLALAFAIYLGARIVHTWEWQITLTKVGRAPFGGLLGALLIGSLVNALVPASAGDVVKVQLISNRYGLSRVGLIAGRGTEAIVDALIMVVFIFISFSLPATGFASGNVLVLLAAGAAVAFVLAALVSKLMPVEMPGWRVLDIFPRRLYEAVRGRWPRFREGLELLRRPRLLAIAIPLNLFGWLVDMGMMWAYGQAFQLDVPLGAYVSLAVAVAIITVFPLTFGNVGTWELALVSALAFHGVSGDQALAFAVGTHVFSSVFVIATGLVAMAVMGIRPVEIFRLRTSADPPPGAS
jgi:uncharacterized protein (TIRG00374 family)